MLHVRTYHGSCRTIRKQRFILFVSAAHLDDPEKGVVRVLQGSDQFTVVRKRYDRYNGQGTVFIVDRERTSPTWTARGGVISSRGPEVVRESVHVKQTASDR